MSISCGPCEAKAGYVEVYPTLLIRTVSSLSARRGRMASERSVPPGARVRVASHTKMDMERSGWLVSSSALTRCSFSGLRPWIIEPLDEQLEDNTEFRRQITRVCVLLQGSPLPDPIAGAGD